MEFPAGRKLSCGVVIVNDAAELLLCHVTGHDHWDLPKGGMAGGETPLESALRETQEETGLVLEPEGLLELGRFEYRLRKDLYLFALRMPRFDAAALHCESRFTDEATGQRLPEMDGYDWFAFERVAEHVTRKMAAVLCGRLDLPHLLARLREHDPAALTV